MHGLEWLPLAAISVLGGVRGVDGFHIEILLIDADDRKTERHVLIVPKRDAGQGRFAGANGIPAGAHQVHGLAQRGQLHRAVRVVGQQRAAGGGHGSVHYPVVAALFGGELHGADKLAISACDFAGDVGEVEALGNFERDGRFQAQRFCGAFDAEVRDIGGVRDLAGEVSGHGQTCYAAEAIFGLPEARSITGDLEFGGPLALEPADAC
jgi:hypothetical protein